MNIYDIAKKAEVSPATVSRVLNGTKGVREETRNRVLAVIEETKYVPSSLARSLSFGTTQNIAFLAPDIENPFFSKLLHGLSDAANEYGYNVFMYGTNDGEKTEQRILEGLRRDMVCGVVIIPVSCWNEETARLLVKIEKEGIPVVLLDRDIYKYDFDSVFSDDYEGARDAVQCLIREGHKKIGIVAGSMNTRPGRERMRGYEKALEDAGIRKQEQYIVNGNFKEKSAYEACKKLMEQEDPPTAVFTSNNMTTLGCLKYFKEQNIYVGKDIAMIGFDEIPELNCTEIHLTTVDRPVYEMGQDALELLEYNFRTPGRTGGEKIVHRIDMVKTKLIVRGSEKMPEKLRRNMP